MSSADPIRILLGPQSPERNVGTAVIGAGLPDGPLAVISAGWQEAEGDIDDLAELVDRPLEDLRLYHRAEEVSGRLPGLAAARRDRQAKLTEQQRLYRLRLKQLSIAARQTLGADGDADIVAAEQRHAIAQLRALDRHHLHRCESIWKDFRDAYDPASNAELAEHAAEIAATIDRCAGIIVTGGNVAILINRMRLFGVDRMLDRCNIVAWSAGAMVLADRIVLFHERSPEGRRDAEVFGAGCGVMPRYVFLPDARHRLRTGDKLRMRLFCRRFAPDVCVALDNGAEMRTSDTGILGVTAVRRLANDGRLTSVRAA